MAQSLKGHVLILGDNDRASLTTVRSLGRAGLKVHLVAFESNSATRGSRHVFRIHHLGHPLVDTEGFVRRLLDVLGRQRFDLVVPTSDASLVPLMPWRDTLAARACLAFPDTEGFAATHGKHHTIAIAERLGIATPRTQAFYRPEEAADTSRLGPYPLVLKPTSSIIAGVPGRNEIRIVTAEAELRRWLPRMLQRCPVLVQEFCRGHGVGLDVLANRGDVIAAFQHRRVHEPRNGGASSYRASTPLSAELLDAARRFCREVRWTGPAMFEFKHDPQTGSNVLMEVNGRFWGSLALAVQAGVDFPRMLYEMLVLGQTRPTFTYRVPYFVRHSTADADWLLTSLRDPAGRQVLRQRGWRGLGAELVNVLLGREGYDLESLSDPRPALSAWGTFLRQKGSKLWQSVDERRCVRLAARQARDRQGLTRALRAARSILFVCHGNINRSAFAEKQLHATGGLRPALRIASAGLVPEGGHTSGPLSREVARDYGIDLSTHQSVALNPRMLDEFDLVFYMEPAHLRSIRAMNRSAIRKCYPLSVLDAHDGTVAIPDPDGRGRVTFEQVYRRIANCVTVLARSIGRPAA
ncbi:MAG: ATP-grasp domain-containing protein [Gemmataceae bacterium]|nr:ATP-grasp domain-containing protein [Gemmataceae bacterium]